MPKVLIVEDEGLNSEVTSLVCEAAGYEVLLAKNGAEALDVLQGEAVDLVLTDLAMPVMDGFGLLGAMRADERWAGLPVLVVTASMAAGDRLRSLARGGEGTYYLEKPVRNRRLLATMEEALSKARQQPASS